MEPKLTGLVHRRLMEVALDRFEDEPVLLLQGPRSVGKSTLLRQLADRLGGALVDLDDVATRDAVAADPATFVARPGVVCIDEYQHVPLVLDAIKAELNRDGRPGRFILTGSACHEALPVAAQALTGRLHRLPVYPLSQGEIGGVEESFLARVLDGDVPIFGPSSTERDDYIGRIVAGGFPVPLSRTPGPRRARWIDDYVRLTLERDVQELTRIEQAAALPRLLERLAGQTAQVLNIARASHLGMNERTVDSYVRLLDAVFLIRRLPAWGTTLTARAGARPKVHVLDSGIAARLSLLNPDKLARRDPTALTELGHLLETFVVGELLKQASWIESIAGIGHWRTRDGDEVDLVIERDDGAVVAFEVKASQRVDRRELAPLRKLRDAAGPSFLAGIALHLGVQSFTSPRTGSTSSPSTRSGGRSPMLRRFELSQSSEPTASRVLNPGFVRAMVVAADPRDNHLARGFACEEKFESSLLWSTAIPGRSSLRVAAGMRYAFGTRVWPTRRSVPTSAQVRSASTSALAPGSAASPTSHHSSPNLRRPAVRRPATSTHRGIHQFHLMHRTILM